MLPTIETAFNVHGPTKKAIAAQCNVTTKTIWKWFTGRTRCPIQKRNSVDKILGFGVDWVGYDLEFNACNRVDQKPRNYTEPLASRLDNPETVTATEAAVLVGDMTPHNGSTDDFQALYGAYL